MSRVGETGRSQICIFVRKHQGGDFEESGWGGGVSEVCEGEFRGHSCSGLHIHRWVKLDSKTGFYTGRGSFWDLLHIGLSGLELIWVRFGLICSWGLVN